MPPFECAILRPEDPRWAAMLGRRHHEFYHWPEYVGLEAKRMGGQPAALWVGGANGAWMLPVVLRNVAEVPGVSLSAAHWRDAVTPYGYPHPLYWVGDADEESYLDDALAALKIFLRSQGIVAVFARCSPLRRLSAAHEKHGHVIAHGPCYWIDLNESAEALRSQMRKNYHYYLKALKRSGVKAHFAPLSQLPAFVGLYQQTMTRIGAAPWYFFDNQYFANLAMALGSSLRLCKVEIGAHALAMGLFVASGGIVQYLFSGSDGQKQHPLSDATKLMIEYVRDWAKEAGLHVFHLGGGFGAREDSLSEFKRGFTRHSSTFYTWRWVVDEDRYATLVAGWERAAGIGAGPIDGYFPAYRKPLPSLRQDTGSSEQAR